MPENIFTGDQLQLLYDIICDEVQKRAPKYYEQHPEAGKVVYDCDNTDLIFGTGDYEAKDYPCFRTLIFEDMDALKRHLTMHADYKGSQYRKSNFSYLAERMAQSRNGKPVKLTEPHLGRYLYFIGCRNFEDVMAKANPAKLAFKAYYYSVRSLELKTFDFECSINHGKLFAEEKGFHEGYPEVRLIGDMTIKGPSVSGMLAAKEIKLLELYVNFNFGELTESLEQLINKKFIYGVVSGNSTYLNGVANSCILVGKDASPEDHLQVKRRLNMTRENFIVDLGGDKKNWLNSVNDIAVGETTLSDLEFLALDNQSYRLVTVDDDDMVTQSLFKIYQEYYGEITQPYRGKPRKLTCTFSLEHYYNNNKVIIVKSYNNAKDQKVVSYTVMPVPDPRKFNMDDTVIVGYYLKPNASELLMKRFYMIRDKEDDIEISRFHLDEMDNKDNEKLKLLKKAILV